MCLSDVADLHAGKCAVGKGGSGLVNAMLVGLVLPIVDDLCQLVQQSDFVPADTEKQRCQRTVRGKRAAGPTQVLALTRWMSDVFPRVVICNTVNGHCRVSNKRVIQVDC